MQPARLTRYRKSFLSMSCSFLFYLRESRNIDWSLVRVPYIRIYIRTCILLIGFTLLFVPSAFVRVTVLYTHFIIANLCELLCRSWITAEAFHSINKPSSRNVSFEQKKSILNRLIASKTIPPPRAGNSWDYAVLVMGRIIQRGRVLPCLLRDYVNARTRFESRDYSPRYFDRDNRR